jgi:hypothetical protein
MASQPSDGHSAELAEILSRFDPSVQEHYERCSTNNWVGIRHEQSPFLKVSNTQHIHEMRGKGRTLNSEPRRKQKSMQFLKKCKFARKVAKKLLCMKKSSCKFEYSLEGSMAEAQIQRGSNTAASNSRPSSISTSLDQLFHQIRKSPCLASDQPNSMEGSMNSITISVGGN